MNTVQEADRMEYGALERDAIKALNRAGANLSPWMDRVRDPERPWAFRWAPESTRGGNVGATAYILQTADRYGLLDRVLTPEQKQQGIAWIKAMETKPGFFIDPALADGRIKIGGGEQEAMSQYARGCLNAYGYAPKDWIAGPPPEDWPQKGSEVLPWIRKVEPGWSWIGRILHRLILWYREGHATREQVMECLDYVHSRQDPGTGFWGGGIQTTFKLLILVHDPMELPIPRAEKIIDSVLRVMDEPTYDDNLFPCEEFDAFYDVAIAWTTVPGYREETIRKLAAFRIAHIVRTHTQADGGISSFTDRCIPTWLAWPMAPAIPQGDVFGWSIYTSGMCIAVDLLGLHDRVPLSGRWRQKHAYDTTPFIEARKSLFG